MTIFTLTCCSSDDDLSPSSKPFGVKYYGSDANEYGVGVYQTADSFFVLGNQLTNDDQDTSIILIKTSSDGTLRNSAIIDFANTSVAKLLRLEDKFYFLCSSSNIILVLSSETDTPFSTELVFSQSLSFSTSKENIDFIFSDRNNLIVLASDSTLNQSSIFEITPTGEIVLEKEISNFIGTRLLRAEENTVSMIGRSQNHIINIVLFPLDSLPYFKEFKITNKENNIDIKGTPVRVTSIDDATFLLLYNDFQNNLNFSKIVLDTTNSLAHTLWSLSKIDTYGVDFESINESEYVIAGNTASVWETNDSDYYILKVIDIGDNYFEEWEETHGFEEENWTKAVIPTNDGGYVILGTTDYGVQTLISFIKTNDKGRLEPF